MMDAALRENLEQFHSLIKMPDQFLAIYRLLKYRFHSKGNSQTYTQIE